MKRDGFNQTQATQALQGWLAYDAGVPHTMANGHYWSEGWITRRWARRNAESKPEAS
jgi:hypothetical protein